MKPKKKPSKKVFRIESYQNQLKRNYFTNKKRYPVNKPKQIYQKCSLQIACSTIYALNAKYDLI